MSYNIPVFSVANLGRRMLIKCDRGEQCRNFDESNICYCSTKPQSDSIISFGRGLKLCEIVEDYDKADIESLKMIHHICFGFVPCSVETVKVNLSNFNGFNDRTKGQIAKLRAECQTHSDLVEIANLLGVINSNLSHQQLVHNIIRMLLEPFHRRKFVRMKSSKLTRIPFLF